MPNGFSGGPLIDYSGSDYLSDQAGWWPGSGSSSDNSSDNGSAGVQVGDAVQVAGGIVGIVMQIVGGVVRIAREDGTQEDHPVANVNPIHPPAITTTEKDYTPIILGSVGVLLVLVLALKK